jgi:peptidoglycan hydrolase-like protein with peptidoglycan-binding domain
MPVYSSIYDGPPNNYGAAKTRKKWIVIHNTSNDAPATNEASYAKRRTDSVSSHYYVDNQRIIQSLNTDYRAFHVGSSTGNAGGIAYEITGTNGKSRSWWMGNVAWSLLAAQIRKDCAAHGITARTLTISEIRAGKTGIITHDQARRAWGGTDHTDPGPNFPMDNLVALIKDGSAPAVPSTGGVPAPPLRENDEGPAVGLLQQSLNTTLGLDLVVDEDYGPATTAAVRELQSRAGITIDGIYGRDSATALRNLLEDNDMSWNEKIDLVTGQGVSYSGTEWPAGFLLASTNYYTLKYGQSIAAEQAKQTALLQQLAAGQSGLTEAKIAAAVAAGVRQVVPSAEELADAVAAAVDHDLDTAAVVAALREVLGGLDGAGE